MAVEGRHRTKAIMAIVSKTRRSHFESTMISGVRSRTEDSDARLRLMISRVLSHDMVPEVLARLKIPQLVQFLYEHPNK